MLYFSSSRSPMAYRFRTLAIWNPSLSYIVIDQKAPTGGISSLEKCSTYLFAPVSGLPSASPRLSG